MSHSRSEFEEREGETLRVVLLSDTHGRHDELSRRYPIPDGDILIHAGDFSPDRDAESDPPTDFRTFLYSLPHRWKVIIPGNHDTLEDTLALADFDCGVICLNQSCAIVCDVFVFGAPCVRCGRTFCFFDAPFAPKARRRRGSFGVAVPEIARGGIVVSHAGPSCTFAKSNVECEICSSAMQREKPIRETGGVLWDEIVRVQPQLHVFGHVHKMRGRKRFGETLMVNAANWRCMEEEHFHEPVVIDFRNDLERDWAEIRCVEGESWLGREGLMWKLTKSGRLQSNEGSFLCATEDRVWMDTEEENATSWAYSDDFFVVPSLGLVLTLEAEDEDSRLVVKSSVPARNQKWRFCVPGERLKD